MNGEAPKQIRVCIRAGKEDWIGVAYAAETSDPSKIHEYIREDLAVATRKNAIEDAASEIFNYVHETDGGHKADFIQEKVIEILSKHFKEVK